MTEENMVVRVRDVLNYYNIPFACVTYSKSTGTAEEAAAVIGCHVAQIVKSLILKTTETNTPILMLVSGVNRVDINMVTQQIGQIDQSLFGQELRMADAKFVKATTGFPIGGVAPVGHASEMLTLIDADIMQQATLWAAAGDPYTVFNISPENVLRITDGHVVRVIY